MSFLSLLCYKIQLSFPVLKNKQVIFNSFTAKSSGFIINHSLNTHFPCLKWFIPKS